MRPDHFYHYMNRDLDYIKYHYYKADMHQMRQLLKYGNLRSGVIGIFFARMHLFRPSVSRTRVYEKLKSLNDDDELAQNILCRLKDLFGDLHSTMYYLNKITRE